ncbi:hypothetical protein Tco_1400872 [Tanacetum coccineum]
MIHLKTCFVTILPLRLGTEWHFIKRLDMDLKCTKVKVQAVYRYGYVLWTTVYATEDHMLYIMAAYQFSIAKYPWPEEPHRGAAIPAAAFTHTEDSPGYVLESYPVEERKEDGYEDSGGGISDYLADRDAADDDDVDEAREEEEHQIPGHSVLPVHSFDLPGLSIGRAIHLTSLWKEVEETSCLTTTPSHLTPLYILLPHIPSPFLHHHQASVLPCIITFAFTIFDTGQDMPPERGVEEVPMTLEGSMLTGAELTAVRRETRLFCRRFARILLLQSSFEEESNAEGCLLF